MGGLDSLLSEIQNLAKEEANQILLSADNEAKRIEKENRKKCADITKEILAKAETDAKNKTERDVSNLKIQHRNEILALKQQLVKQTVEKAKKKVLDMPDGEYFNLLKGWAAKTGVSSKAVIYVNSKDLKRDKGDFLKGFKAEAEASLAKESADISGGFLAVCGGVTINCSVDAIFDSYIDDINRELRSILFD